MSKVDIKRESERRLKHKVGRKYTRDAKLQELERQLEFAESRCGTLKQQLDYIKRMYGCARVTNLESQASRDEGHGDGSNVKQFSLIEISKWKNPHGNFPNREDGDGPELMQNSVSHSNTTSTNSSSKPLARGAREEIKKKSPHKPRTHFKLLKVKKKGGKKMKKRRRSDDGGSSKVSNASSQTQYKMWQDPVVEIYKNSAANVESESGFVIIGRHKSNKSNEVLSEVLRQKISDKIKNTKKQDEIGKETKTKSSNSVLSKTNINLLKEEGMQTEQPLDVNQLITQTKRNDILECLNKENAIKLENIYTDNVKSYCQPTISSKKKQVERDIYSNLTNLKIRNIPFIAAKSTAPSHNIGINIQQVLSIIKKRQPKNDLIAACNDNGNHENPLVSLISSRKIGSVTNQSEIVSAAGTGTAGVSSSESKMQNEGPRTNLSHWKSISEINKEKTTISDEKPDEDNCNNNNNNSNNNWSFKVDKLKKVLVFLHEDFTSLSQKYKRLQKKLTKRNITKTDAKDELANIERDLEKKEEEITVVIALYKEVLNLRDDFKKLQEKYNLVTSGRTFAIDGLRQSNSTHIQMMTLLRKIQNFQDKLKG